MPELRFTVFEAANETLKEIYVGVTSQGIHHVITQYRGKPPVEISHWRPFHQVTYRSIEASVAASYAAELVALHAGLAARPGWTVIAGGETRGR